MRRGRRVRPARSARPSNSRVDCGRNFDAVESAFDFAADDGVVGIGITEHPHAAGFPEAVLTKDPERPLDELWEENKDGGLGRRGHPRRGGDARGIRARERPAKTPGNANHLLLVKARDGVPVRYFTGAGWNRSGQFADRAAWETYVKGFAAARGESADRHRECAAMNALPRIRSSARLV